MGPIPRRVVFGCMLLVNVVLWALPAAAEAPRLVAYIDQVFSASDPGYKPARLSDVLVVERNGRPIPIAGSSVALQADDRIVVTDPDKTAIVYLIATRRPVPVRHHAGSHDPYDYRVESAITGLPEQVAAVLFGLMTSPSQRWDRTVGAGSRGIGCYNETGKTNEPMRFEVPILASERSYLSAGERALFVSWRGGAPPFKVVLADALTGATLTERGGIQDSCAIILPAVKIDPGRQYRLSVVDKNDVREEETNIFGVADAPAMPHELATAPLDAESRRLYFATWLTLQAQGTWTFEAQQRVAAMGCARPATLEWMKSFNGEGLCPSGSR